MEKIMRNTIFLLVIIILLGSIVVNAEGADSDILYKLEGWTKINDNIYISTGNYLKVNMVLVVSDKKATLIDLGYEEAEGQRVKDFIEENQIKLENIILTHHHSDHKGNADMFQVPKDNYYRAFKTSNGQIIEMGSEKFRIIKTPGHASNYHDSIELVNHNILVAGDVIPTNWLPLLKYGGSYHKLKKSLEKIKQNNYKMIIPGHGDIVKAELAVNNQLHYLNYIYNTIKKLAAASEEPITKEELYKKIKYSDAVINTDILSKQNQTLFHKSNIDQILKDIERE